MSARKKFNIEDEARIWPTGTEISVTKEHVSPEVASTYLALNIVNNRNLRPKYVAELAREMAAGRWEMSGDPIRFDDNGRLVDGQHRLRAVESLGKKFAKARIPFVVVRGLDPGATRVIDTGRSRRPMDALRIAGYTNTALLSASLRVLLTIKQGPLVAKQYPHFTHAELIELAERHPLLHDSTYAVRTIRGVRPSLVCSMHYVGAILLQQPSAADAYVGVFNSGIPGYKGDPAHMLREKMLHERGASVRTTDSFSLLRMAHVWNHFVKGNQLNFLKFPNVVEIEGLDLDKI